ncbi:MAG: sigma-54 dependent transcriptional regulator [Chitinispirillia bacterium]|jgi:DNA-binding NtrC family response regulator
MTAEKVLIIENEVSFRQEMLQTLKKNGYFVSEADTTDEGLEFIKKNNPGIVIIDINEPDMFCSSALETIVECNPETHVIILSDSNTIKNVVTLKKSGSFNYLQKPFDENKLITILKNSVSKEKVKYPLNVFKPLFTKIFNFNIMITSNKKMLNALQAIEKAMNSDYNLFFQGENGTGKEIIARTIHLHSKRKEKPFIVVNCSLIPEKLSDSILFGHEKDSFQGASLQKIGKLESAAGGTVFLNDIDSLNLSSQQKLIESIRNKTITRIGGKKPIYTDIRIIFASNGEIKKDGININFIENIFSILCISSIILPSLRERKEDIKPLVTDYIETTYKYKDKVVDQSVWELFINYNWPGNVRELFEVVERGCIISDEIVRAEHLPEYFLSPSLNSKEEVPEYSLNSIESDEIVPLETVEREALIHAINVTRGNISLAAKKLGIGRATFYRKAKAYNLKNLPMLSQKGRAKSRN